MYYARDKLAIIIIMDVAKRKKTFSNNVDTNVTYYSVGYYLE